MRTIRWLLLLSVVGLHIVMKAPVWHLISRVGIVGGSTGWQRFALIDHFIGSFGEWWLMGTSSTVHWGLDMFDVANEYVLEGVQGGLLTFGLFLGVIGKSFGSVGRLWRSCRSDRYRVRLAWALGVSLLVHCLCFIGVSYFGQIVMLWYLLLAVISSLLGTTTLRSNDVFSPRHAMAAEGC